jgi:hypothetical protein
MEKYILDVIDENYNSFTGVNEAHLGVSKQLASDFRAFMEWVAVDVCILTDNGKYWYELVGNQSNQFTFDELFNYWLENIK